MEYSLAIGEMTIHALKLPTNKHHVMAVKFDDEDCLYKVALFRTEADARWFMECLAEQLEEACRFEPAPELLRQTIDYVPAADVVPWDWLEKFAEGKRYNYLSDFLIEAKVVFYRELVKEANNDHTN